MKNELSIYENNYNVWFTGFDCKTEKRIYGFSKIFIERPRFAIVIALVLTIAGVISLFSLPIALYPQITPPEINISASYTGASAEVVANSIGIPIEQEVNGVEDMIYMSSSSSNS